MIKIEQNKQKILMFYANVFQENINRENTRLNYEILFNNKTGKIL